MRRVVVGQEGWNILELQVRTTSDCFHGSLRVPDFGLKAIFLGVSTISKLAQW